MTARKSLSTISLALALSGCIVVPAENKVAMPSCKTYTKSMKLDAVDLTPRYAGGGAGCGDKNCLAATLAILAGSAIVSGSIVLANNTAHWLEYQGTCSDSYLNTAKQRFLDSFDKPRQPSAG
jgi:hypothetical protein